MAEDRKLALDIFKMIYGEGSSTHIGVNGLNTRELNELTLQIVEKLVKFRTDYFNGELE